MLLKKITALLIFFSLIEGYAKQQRVLYIDSPTYIGGAGFFHNFHLVLGGLYLCKKNPHITVCVDFSKEGLYYDPSKGDNWWNYYFEPIGHMMSMPIRPSLIKRLSNTEKGDVANFIEFHMTRDKVHELITQHIHVRQEIIHEVDAFFDAYMRGYFVIGIHYRGTDKGLEARRVPYDEVIRKVQRVIKDRHLENYKIFVATDEALFLKEVQEYFNGCVIATLAQRSNGNGPIHYALDRKAYDLGKEALVDCLLLAKCQLMLRTNSNLSTAAAFFNPDLEVMSLNYPNDDLYQGLLKRGFINELNRKP